MENFDEFMKKQKMGKEHGHDPEGSYEIMKEYRRLIEAGEVEKARDMIREKFETLLRSKNLSHIIGREGYVFKVMYKPRGEMDFEVFGEADSADEALDLFRAVAFEQKGEDEEEYDFDIWYEPKDR